MPGWSMPATLTIPSQVNPGADCIRGEALPDYALTDPAESHELKRARQAHVHHRLRQRVHRPTDIKTRVPAPPGPRWHRYFVLRARHAPRISIWPAWLCDRSAG